jgi:hypothetical protein
VHLHRTVPARVQTVSARRQQLHGAFTRQLGLAALLSRRRRRIGVSAALEQSRSTHAARAAAPSHAGQASGARRRALRCSLDAAQQRRCCGAALLCRRLAPRAPSLRA